MTWTPSPTELADHASKGEGQVRVERLEFGKFCVDPDGPVERDRDGVPTEHGQLGRTSGFPADVARFCDPSIMGILAGETDPSPPACPHGTVFRPVVINGKETRSVFYRVRTRPEAGEGRTGRSYILARYLMAENNNLDPLTLLNAMDSRELRGMTRAEASDLTALSAFSDRPMLSRMVEAFRREAVRYILSGVPISILANISEGEFFSCVAALWPLLPVSLRAHLSASWGSGNSFSGGLSVTHTARKADDCALFSPTNLTWTSPEQVTIWNANYEPVRRSFSPQRLEPGDAFVKFFFEDAGGWPDIPSQSLDEKTLSLIDTAPEVQFPELPDWHDPATIWAFRYPGLKARDEFSYARLAEWLESDEDEEFELPLDVRRTMTYESTRLRSLRAVLNALTQPGSRRRGSMVLWASVMGRCPQSFIDFIAEIAGSGGALAQLLTALSQNDLPVALHSLTLAAERGEVEHLLPAALSHLHATLDASIESVNRESLALHARLLRLPLPRTGPAASPATLGDDAELPPVPTAYTEWLRLRDLRLMRALASVPGTFSPETFSKIVRITGSPAAHALYEMLFGYGLPENLREVVTGLSFEERQVFASVLDNEWRRVDGNVTMRREQLLSWVRQLGMRDNAHPLLRLETGELRFDDRDRELSLERFRILAEDVEHARVPLSLEIKVSAFTLEHWFYFHQWMGAHENKWLDVIKYWPRPLAQVFGHSFAAAFHIVPVPPEIERVAHALLIPREQLNGLLAQRLPQLIDRV
jgi:hypothetical protein